MVILCLTLRGTTKLIYSGYTILYPTSNGTFNLDLPGDPESYFNEGKR
jgi:hypothetical protein